MTELEQLNTLKEALLKAHRDDIANHRCEWHVATGDPLVNAADLPTCRKTVTCVGETPGKRNQYWLCDEHGQEWIKECALVEDVKPGREGRVIEPWTRYMSILSEVDDTIVFDNGGVVRKTPSE